MATALIWFAHAPPGASVRRVAGLSLALRGALAAQAAGFGRIVVVPRAQDGPAVRRELTADRRLQADVAVVWDLASPGRALDHLADRDRDEVAVALGDRVWIAPVLQALAGPLSGGSRARLLVDGGGEASFSGMLRVRGDDLERLPLENEPAGDGVVAALGGPGTVETRAMDGRWRRVAGDGDVRDAESLLLRGLVKPADGIVSRNINRRISTSLSRHLARRTVRPNHVTAVVCAIGVCAGPLAWLGTYAGFALGGLCYYVSAILDGCDGELARLKHLGSPLGAWLDTVVDDLVGLSWLVGMYLGLARGPSPLAWWVMGGVAVPAYLLTVLPRYYLFATGLGAGDLQKLAAASRSADPRGFARVVWAVRDVVFRTDFLPFAAFVTAAVGLVPVFAVPYAAGSVAAFADTVGTVARFRRPKPADGSTTAQSRK